MLERHVYKAGNSWLRRGTLFMTRDKGGDETRTRQVQALKAQSRTLPTVSAIIYSLNLSTSSPR